MTIGLNDSGAVESNRVQSIQLFNHTDVQHPTLNCASILKIVCFREEGLKTLLKHHIKSTRRAEPFYCNFRGFFSKYFSNVVNFPLACFAVQATFSSVFGPKYPKSSSH